MSDNQPDDNPIRIIRLIDISDQNRQLARYGLYVGQNSDGKWSVFAVETGKQTWPLDFDTEQRFREYFAQHIDGMLDRNNR